MLVSGFLSNIEYAWLYPSLAGFLARLASFSRLILMDRRGSGLSDRISAPPPIETSLEDVEVVLDEVGSPKTTLFGLWDGCATSILFAATRPERVASLVLFSSSPAQTPKEDYPWGWTESRWAEWLTSIREGWGSRAWDRPQRSLDGAHDARRPGRARTLDHLHAARRQSFLRGDGNAQLEEHRYSAGAAGGPGAGPRAASQRRPGRADRSGPLCRLEDQRCPVRRTRWRRRDPVARRRRGAGVRN